MSLTSTTKIVTLDGVPARIWQGESEAGVPVMAFIVRVVPTTHEGPFDEFETFLETCEPPKPEAFGIPSRLTL